MTTFRSIEDRVRAIAELAYYLWRERGCPNGSPEEDWYRAELIFEKIETPPSLIRELSPMDIAPGERATGGFMAPYGKTYG